MHYGTTTLPHLPRNNTAGKINIQILHHNILLIQPMTYTTFIKITFHSSLQFSVTKSTVKVKTWAVHSSTVGSGTALHSKRLQVRFPMGSLGYFVHLILPVHYCPGVNLASASNRKKLQRYLLGGGGGGGWRGGGASDHPFPPLYIAEH